MDQKALQINKQKWDRLVNLAGGGNGLAAALAGQTVHLYNDRFKHQVWNELTLLYGKQPSLISVEEFFCPTLKKVFTDIAGKEMADIVPDILSIRLEGQFSSSPRRRSYRSKQFSYYISEAIDVLCSLIRQACYTESVKERLFYNTRMCYGYEYLLAMEIRRGNSEIISLIHEALLCDNSRIQLSYHMLKAIIISADESLLNDLFRLLLAAKQQEGLRQLVFEVADIGRTDILIRMLKLCLDEDLFRFSSTIRAFDTWTGMGYGDTKPASIKKYAQYAYDCLTDEKLRQVYLESGDNTKAYFSMWATGCHEAAELDHKTELLLSDSQHYRRILGWFFVSRIDHSALQMSIAAKHLSERDEEVLAWLVHNLSNTHQLLSSGFSVDRPTGEPIPNPSFPNDRTSRYELFCQLRELADFIGNKKRTFTGNPFAFSSITLENEPVYNCMISLAGYDMDKTMIEELLALAPKMNSDHRQALLNRFIKPETTPAHRQFLYLALNDRSVTVKETAVSRLSACKLSAEDLRRMADALRSKSSDLRKNILCVFYKQDIQLLRPLVTEMLISTEEYQNQAAIEIIKTLQKTHPDLLKANTPLLLELRHRKPSTQTEILLDQLLVQDQTGIAYSAENGYGLYDPASVLAFANQLHENSLTAKKQGLFADLFNKKKRDANLWTEREIQDIFPDKTELNALFKRIDDVFVRHADYEYETMWYDGSRHKVLFGDIPEYYSFNPLSLPSSSGVYSLRDPKARLEMVPFAEEILDAFGQYARDVRKMLGLYYVTSSYNSDVPMRMQLEYLSWFLPVSLKNLAPNLRISDSKQPPRFHWMLEMIAKLPYLFDLDIVFDEALHIYCSMITIIGQDNLDKPYLKVLLDPRVAFMGNFTPPRAINHRMLGIWRKLIGSLELSHHNFAQWFLLEYPHEKLVSCQVNDGLKLVDYLRACDNHLISEEVLLDYLLTAPHSWPPSMQLLTTPGHRPEIRKFYTDCAWLSPLVQKLTDRMVTVEQRRGEMPTSLTARTMEIARFEGAHHFCNLLAALGKDTFFRGYLYSKNCTKKEALSQLLKRCYPAKEDTPQRLKELLKKTDIRDTRLVEAVMYAPQWAGFAEEILGWPGLKCGVWFFHAHINETFTAEKETETAIYSPISPQQFNDGAFDKNWFFAAYRQLGEKRFQLLYKSAKYITSGSNQHRRSQLYADAVLGRLDADALKAEITEKRNQEKLRCYPLIPIADNDHQEALRRYEFIQKFLKESKQFGSQRKESEKKACATAMENLAITTGLMDVNRLMWQMESAKLEHIRPLMEPMTLDGIQVRLRIDDNGDASLAMEKDGKLIKTVPKTLTKSDAFLALKATVKELKEQKRRSKESLERAMIESTIFDTSEVSSILANPVLSPMVRKLVWVSDNIIGFPTLTDNTEDRRVALDTLTGTLTIAGNQLRLAHPHDLRTAGVWADYMRLLYEKKWVQPFKQVFREYYPITEDERQERTISRRYAGHQVQPKRTVALLKTRGWTVDYEEGLQKVFYKENLIVRMFALADWFSPAEVEAPTLETVEFFDRNTGANVPLEEIPPVLFSETMRDLDLVVSVAHVGGVDPEASHSTVEMRIAIATELAHLLKLANVSWIGSHAKIHGQLASYSVHMGSGVVHAEGIGAVAILPVHSQARGRIFLPFADDDSKTAEIMSKIILLAEDKKIKDPSILQQLQF